MTRKSKPHPRGARKREAEMASPFALDWNRLVVRTLSASRGSNDDRALAAAVPDQSAPSIVAGLVRCPIGGSITCAVGACIGVGGGIGPFHAGGAGEGVEGEKGSVDGHEEQVIAAVHGAWVLQVRLS